MPHGARYEVIEGQRTFVSEPTRPIHQKLDAFLGAMTLVTYRDDFALGGASTACVVQRTHRWKRFREGRHMGLDGVVRDVRLLMCEDCGAVEVHDISFDVADGAVGRRGPARKNHVIGWYSGARRSGRQYR